MMNCTILVIEDEPAISKLIALNLKFAGYKVFEASNTNIASSLMLSQLPDVIILDWMLPGSSGIDFAKHLRGVDRTKNIPVIMLTARSSDEDKVRGLDCGADDYITKPFSPKELVARIKAVLRRRAPQLTDEIVIKCGIVLNPSIHKATGNGNLLKLGPTEFKLLHFFLTHSERVHTRTILLDNVWGDNVFVEERTVDVHIRRLRKALIPTTHHIHIETIRGSGYRFTTNPERQTKTKL